MSYMYLCMCYGYVVCFFLFKQKTAYEMRISDWSSDVCSSDLGLFVSNAHAHEAGDWILKLGATQVSPKSDNGSALDDTVDLDVNSNVRPSFTIEIGRASCRERVCQYV